MRKLIVILSVVFSFTMVQPAVAATSLKKTVAVFDFQNDSGYNSLPSLASDFSTQLSDALVQSNMFNVLTRTDLDAVFAEQDLAASGRMAKSNTAKKGKAIPAQFLIKGRVTEFEENTSGGGQGINVKGFKLGTKKSTASVAVIIQLINSTTGEIIESQRVEGEARSGGLSLGYSGAIDINSSNFKKTPLGKAVQMAIDRAVDFISKRLSKEAWKGKVVTVKDGVVFINAGANVGVSEGDKFAVLREGESLIDPDTGIELGSDTSKLGFVRVMEVKDKFSKAETMGEPSSEILKGDLITE